MNPGVLFRLTCGTFSILETCRETTTGRAEALAGVMHCKGKDPKEIPVVGVSNVKGKGRSIPGLRQTAGAFQSSVGGMALEQPGILYKYTESLKCS